MSKYSQYSFVKNREIYVFSHICVYCYTLVAGLLDRSQYPEGPATGHLGTGFSRFPCV